DRMDRAISRIWIGGDLATMSAGGQAVGSQPQNDDLDNLVAADCAMISDALQEHVDRWVIRQLFGEDAEPLAYFQLMPPTRMDVAQERQTDQLLSQLGVAQSIADVRARYGRSAPDEGEPLVRDPGADARNGIGSPGFPPAPADARLR